MNNDLNIDLNIDNYTLDDLLNMFELSHSFNKNDLKRAKRIVLKMHPDLSGLPSEYFMFYSKIYNILYDIYNFKNINNKTENDFLRKEYFNNDDKNVALEKFAQSTLKNDKSFNEKFNEMFNKYSNVKLNDELGYDEWFRNKDTYNDNNFSNTNIRLDQFDDFFKEKKNSMNIIHYNDIQDIDSSTNVSCSYLDNDENTSSYEAPLFSSLQYNDLKNAYENTIIPVTNDDFNRREKYKNINELEQRRLKDMIGIEKHYTNQYKHYENKNNYENKQAGYRTFKLLQQMEKQEINNTKFVNELLRLK